NPGKGGRAYSLSGERGKNMSKQMVLAILLSISLTTGCGHNPQKQKQYYLESGKKFLQQGQPHEATIQFRNALQIDPRYVEAYRGLGQAYYQLEQWPEAAAALSLAAEIDPKDLATHFILAEVYLNSRDFPNAQKEVAVILKRKPQDASAYQLQGAALAGSGNN